MALSKPQSSIGCDKTRYLRCALVIVDELTQVLRDVLENEIPHPLLYHNVSSSTKLFQRLQKQSDQLRLIQNAYNDGYKEFDITLLYTLISNLCSKHISPSNGWWNPQMPSHGEIKLGDDIERIRLIKNKLYSHIPTARISETDFNEYWAVVHGVCQRIGNFLNRNYIASLRKAEICSIDEELEKKVLEKTEKMYERDNEMREQITEIVGSVRRIEKDLFFATAKVTVQLKDPAKKGLSEVLLETTGNLLNEIVDCINEVTTEEELEKIYESVEEFLREESTEKIQTFIEPLLHKLSSKIRNYANPKVRRICILAKYFKFVMKLKTDYVADIKCYPGSLLLKLTFYSEEGYKCYHKDLEGGKIGREILDLLLFPAYIACFGLNVEEMIVFLNDKAIGLHSSGCVKMPEKTKQQNPHKILVAAIDIGTTYSGYAYSFKDNWTKIKTSDWSNWNPMSHKAPTALLLNPDRTFNSFGYEAEKNYIDLLESGDKDYYFFQRFKMILETALEKRVNIKTKCMDENKKELDAIEVFTHCIRYLKDHLLENLNNTLINKIEVNNITFVITVPAIWDDVAKKFMRKAAEAAGIPSAQLLLALEPEAASIYFLFTQPDNQDGTRMKGMADTEYVILDIGGGKTDITVHQQQNHNLVELIPATGGAWGDTCVDKAFYIFLENIFGDEVLKRFSSEGEYKVDYFTFWQEFEKTKIKNGRRTCVRNNVRIHLPFVLLEIAKEVLNNKDMEEKEPINRCIENSKYRGKVRYQRGVLIVPSRIFDEIFHPMIRNITTHLEGIFRKESKYINTLLMVGGFAYNDVLRSEIREKFQDKRVVTPEQAELVVLKGAVYFGHIPDVFTTRVARYTYGIETCPRFDSFIHSLKKKEIISGEERSRDVFLKFISRGEYIEPGMRKSYIFQSRQNEERKVECGVFISNSEDPFYIDEKGCFKLGTIEIPICDRIVPAEIEMSFIFGETEIRVTASNFATGKQYEVKFDLLAEGIDMPDSRT